ncbi:MAG: lysine-sensitive aspartokinase 3 [Acidobacteriota bacterium]
MIVMKFGGTSVEDANAIRNLIAIVKLELERCPIVVVSAMARVTNGLLAAANHAAAGRVTEARATLEAIAAHHFTTATELTLSSERDELARLLEERFDELRRGLDQIAAAGVVTPELCDLVASNGELLSSLVVTAALRASDIDAVWVDIRPLMRTDGDFTRAAVDFGVAEPLIEQTLGSLVSSGKVPVTQGFIGSTATGATTTIGRGGSDYSAAIIGSALKVDEIEIWTDVDGIMTTDPRVVPEASKVHVISFAEAAELAYFGAKVLHPSALLPAMAKEIPVSVRNSRRPDLSGTRIVRQAPPSGALVKAIAFKRGITVVNVTSDRMLMAYGFLARLFDVFMKHQTAVDMVATSEVGVSMTLDDTRHLEEIIADLSELGEVSVESDRALICLVGERLKFTAGVAARVFSTIEHINVSMISHGASSINVSFIVEGAQVEEAVRSLHAEFFEEVVSSQWSVVSGQ